MTDRTKTPWHLWVVGILTLLWNAVGGFSYTMTRLGKLQDLGMTPDQIAYFDSYPIWANTFWALGVWGAIAGSLLLLLKSRHAVTAIIIATVGLIGTTVFQHILTETPEELKNAPLSIAIWATTLFMLWYAHRQKAAGVLK
ncbi:MAG: hypothetical protein ABJ242_12555 [Marinomonas sp.]